MAHCTIVSYHLPPTGDNHLTIGDVLLSAGSAEQKCRLICGGQIKGYTSEGPMLLSLLDKNCVLQCNGTTSVQASFAIVDEQTRMSLNKTYSQGDVLKNFQCP